MNIQIESGEEKINKKVLYAQAVFGEEEKQAVLKSMDNGWLASGPIVKKFESAVAAHFQKKYGVAVNSGSSANLLAIAALGLQEGGEVITPACTFATTVSAIVLNKLVPIFVDSEIGRYTINEALIEEAVTGKTVAIMVPQLIGGVCDMERILGIAQKYNLKVIDDSCDTFAPYLNGKSVASYADITTTSFYGSHIITALGMGGMIMTDDEKVRDRLLVFRDWGRVGNDRENFEDRFNFKIDDIPYDSKFLYGELGFNVKMIEAAAAFGLVQLERIYEFTTIRNRNFHELVKFFDKYRPWFHLPRVIDGAATNWLAFPLTITENAPFTRYEFLKHLEENGIQTRVIFSGNITRHPLYKKVNYKVKGSLVQADEIMANGLLVGCNQGMSEADVQFVIETAEEFLTRYQ